MFGVTQRQHEAMLMDARALDGNDIRSRQLPTLWVYMTRSMEERHNFVDNFHLNFCSYKAPITVEKLYMQQVFLIVKLYRKS